MPLAPLLYPSLISQRSCVFLIYFLCTIQNGFWVKTRNRVGSMIYSCMTFFHSWKILLDYLMTTFNFLYKCIVFTAVHTFSRVFIVKLPYISKGVKFSGLRPRFLLVFKNSFSVYFNRLPMETWKQKWCVSIEEGTYQVPLLYWQINMQVSFFL